MAVYASIRGRLTPIVGYPHSGWRIVTPSVPDARSLHFHFDITDDGAGSYLLCYYSADDHFAADTWHPSLVEAFALAGQLGVRRSEWRPGVQA